MWPLIYLSLLNIGLGFLAALVVYFRIRYVRRQVESGYDMRRLLPPSKFRNRLRRFGAGVNVDKVCSRLGETPPTPPSREPVVLSGSDVSSIQVANEDDGSGTDAGKATGVCEAGGSLERDIKTFDPIDRPEVTARELVPRPEQEPRDVRCLEPLTAKYGGEPTVLSSTLRGNAQVDESTSPSEPKSDDGVESLSPRTPAKSIDVAIEETTTAAAKEVETLAPAKPLKSVDATELNPNRRAAPVGKQAETEVQKTFAADRAGEGDFLQRAANIDRMLRAVMDEKDPDPESTLQAVIAEVQGTHQWWTQFEGSVSKAITNKAPAQAPREQKAQIDDDLVAMQACLVECHNLIESTTSGTNSRPKSTVLGKLTTSEFPREMHNFLIQATKACHRLRDNLGLMIPESPLRFRETSGDNAAGPPPLAYVSEIGVQGVDAIVSQWEVEAARGHSSLASLVLVDVDRTSHWNNELGLESVDRILTVCHRQLAESVRSNRGFDRVVRISGQQFLVFLGSTDSKQAKFAAERLRQVFANTTWRESGQALVIQVSTAVSSYDVNQPIGLQISRLRMGLPEAKRLGGNSAVEQVQSGRFQKISGVPKYPLPARHHDQPLEKWKPKASVTC
ncbi:MAG: diguanylate cyclase [Pirellulaceae bacterium]|nr:diguanylate cyclase [Pirellulaceae bacterium]